MKVFRSYSLFVSVAVFTGISLFATHALAQPGTSTTAVSKKVQPQDSEPIFRLSLPTETDYQAWQSSGFRVSLGYGFGTNYGSYGVPDGRSNSFMLRAGARLDKDWLLYGSVRYGITAGGLRYMGLIEPTYEILPQLTISAGVGLAGFVIASFEPPEPPSDGVIATYTYASDDTPLVGCSGEGVAGQVRLAYSLVVGSLFSMGPALSFNAQATRCAQTLQDADPDTGRAIELEQYWYHRGFSLDWMFQWR